MGLIPNLLMLIQTVVLHVSVAGSDTHLGTTSQPLRSIEGAKHAARQHPGKKLIVEFESGTYRLDHPIVFSHEDSGDVTYRARPGATVRFLGSKSFVPKWKPYKGKILQCSTPADFDTDQLFINGEKQVWARYPNEDLNVRIFHGFAKDAISPQRFAGWKNPEGGYFHAMHASLWGDFHYRILGKDANHSLNLEGGWQNNRQSGLHPEYRFVEGIFEELDAPGEWFHDRKTHILYYFPRAGVDLKDCLIEGPVLRHLFEFRGAHGITMQGFSFEQTTRTFMDNREPLLRSDWTTYRGGALYFTDSKNCEITDSVLKDLGGNAVFVDGKNQNIAIRRCRIEDVGGNGVAFVGSPKAVRSPLFEYNQRQTFASMDKQPGPKSDDYPSHCTVEDCIITRTGTVEKQTAGVQISISKNVTVRHCSIYHVPRAGVNICDGCFGGHVIEGCDVFDTVLETGDHGSFNSWGRDRYWGLTDVDMNKGEHPELASLDCIEPITLRNNRWRCDHGWDIDLDDGSSNYVIVNNLCLNGGLKNREGFNRRVENNIMVDNSFHPHVWFQNSGDVFRHNIVSTPYQPIEVPKPWGKDVNFNFLHQAEGADSQAADLANQSGRDGNSMMGNADFVNPAEGDYRVREGSPALLVGFKNFEMDSFGVRPKNLKALAQHPRLTNQVAIQASVAKVDWQGAQAEDLVNPSMISAVGLGENLGVVLTKVATGSNAEAIGLRTLDVIQQVDGIPVRSVKELERVKLPARSLTVWRQQHSIHLRIP